MVGLSKPVLIITGPTASGKSELGVQIAKELGTEVISADAVQIYKGMDIGTAKITPGEMQGIRHHLLDVVYPDEPFTVADWTECADDVIAKLHREGKLPIVVGGTALYVRSITDNLDFAASKGKSETRRIWQEFAEQRGNALLHQELRLRDPVSAERLHPNDVRRVVRALEVFEMTGKPMSEEYDFGPKDGRYACVQVALTMDREALYNRVNRRVDVMMSQGLKSEVERLLAAGYHRSLTSMQGIGYKEMAAHCEGEITEHEAVELIKQGTRRFVKRQLSWFRRDTRVQWVTKDAEGNIPNGDMQRIFAIAKQLSAGILTGSNE